MRKSIILALALTSSFALTACGRGKHSAKAKVAAAKAVGDKGTLKKVAREEDEKIQQTSKSLANQGFHGLEDGYSIQGAIDKLTGVSPEARAKVKSQLGSVKGQAEAMIDAGKSLGGAEGDDFVKRGETYLKRATDGIEQMNRAEKAEQEKRQSN